jgi:hypothetical protein
MQILLFGLIAFLLCFITGTITLVLSAIISIVIIQLNKSFLNGCC